MLNYWGLHTLQQEEMYRIQVILEDVDFSLDEMIQKMDQQIATWRRASENTEVDHHVMQYTKHANAAASDCRLKTSNAVGEAEAAVDELTASSDPRDIGPSAFQIQYHNFSNRKGL